VNYRNDVTVGALRVGREHGLAGAECPADLESAAQSYGAAANLVLEARDMLSPITMVPHGLAAALTRMADAHGHLQDVLPTKPPAQERLSVRAVLDEASDHFSFHYGAEPCTCGTHGTPAATCPVHWSLYALEQAGLYA
jgi:hypothetical protein